MIHPRKRADRGETAIVLALTALVAIVSVVSLAAAAVAGLAVVALTVTAWRRRAPAATSLGLLFVVCLALGVAGIGPQQVVFAIAFAVYAVAVARVPWLRGAAGWLRPGAIDGTLVGIGAAFAALSAVALLVWYVRVGPELADLVRRFIPMWPAWALVPAAIVFSMANAALEEAAYRGVVQEALDAVLGAGAAAVVLQAVAFAALHFREGFPRGAVGVGLAFVYGIVLGALRRRAGGLIVPWLTHGLTDLAIVSIVLALVRR